MISLVVEVGDGRSVEVASVGREGAIGGIISCGFAPAYARAEVIVAGPALRIGLDARLKAEGLPHDGLSLADGERLIRIDCAALTGHGSPSTGRPK